MIPQDLMPHNEILVRPRFVVGLDLGKQTDFSALAALRFPWPTWEKPTYELPTLKRWALGTAYLEIAADVAKFLKSLTLLDDLAKPLLVVDATGVGDAVYEMLRAEMVKLEIKGLSCAVTITGGSAATKDPKRTGRWRVAKKALASVLQVLLGQRRLQIAQTLPEAKILQQELGTFSVKITDSLNETFESWRERDHDDLVLAVALAAWAAASLPMFRPPNLERAPSGWRV